MTTNKNMQPNLMTQEVNPMQETAKKGAGRRQFLKMAGLGAAVSGATLGLAGRKGEAAVAQPEATASGQGYRETELIQRYYALARF